MKKSPAYDGTQICLNPRPDAAEAFAGRAGAPSNAAKQLCATCPFLTQCRTYALSEDVHGVWGGMTERERRRLLRRHPDVRDWWTVLRRAEKEAVGR